ncbi:MAG: ferredoxin [Thermodesulfobacteriota bacterium]
MAKEFYIVAEDCLACGSCAELCPDCFRFEEGAMEHAEVTGFDCPEEKVQEAMDNCPGQCIFWRE